MTSRLQRPTYNSHTFSHLSVIPLRRRPAGTYWCSAEVRSSNAGAWTSETGFERFLCEMRQRRTNVVGTERATWLAGPFTSAPSISRMRACVRACVCRKEWTIGIIAQMNWEVRGQTRSAIFLASRDVGVFRSVRPIRPGVKPVVSSLRTKVIYY